MRRFEYDDNEEFREDVDKFFNNDDEDDDDGDGDGDGDGDKYEDMIEQEMAIQEAQLDVAYRELSHRTLRAAVRVCEKSFWWGFYSINTRMKMIAEAYHKLKNLEE